MITSPRVFDDAHLPRELVHRESEVEALTGALQPALDGDRANDIFISGPSGVGKTVLARHSLDRLAEHADVEHAHVRCLGKTTTSILRAALAAHPRGEDLAENTPQDDVLGALEDTVTRPFVLVLDEADDLPATDTLERLAPIPEVSVVVICHDPERWLAQAGEHVRRSLTTHIQPDRYTVPELVDILTPRADEGLEAGVVTDAQLREVADEVAGVARRGIQSLRAAAELAGERGHSTITETDIADCFERARKRIRESNLQSLTFHHQVLYELIRNAGTIRGEALNNAYDEHAEAVYHGHPVVPIGKRWRRRNLQKLQEYDLVKSEEIPIGKKYAVVDETLESPLTLPVAKV